MFLKSWYGSDQYSWSGKDLKQIPHWLVLRRSRDWADLSSVTCPVTIVFFSGHWYKMWCDAERLELIISYLSIWQHFELLWGRLTWPDLLSQNFAQNVQLFIVVLAGSYKIQWRWAAPFFSAIVEKNWRGSGGLHNPSQVWWGGTLPPQTRWGCIIPPHPGAGSVSEKWFHGLSLRHKNCH